MKHREPSIKHVALFSASENQCLLLSAVFLIQRRNYPFASTRVHVLFCRSKRGNTISNSIDLPQGTLDLVILRTVSLGPQHGWAIAERVQQISSDVLRIQQGSLYPALHRLERRGFIKASWGVSDNNRRAKYYKLTRAGQRQLDAGQKAWENLTAAIQKILVCLPEN